MWTIKMWTIKLLKMFSKSYEFQEGFWISVDIIINQSVTILVCKKWNSNIFSPELILSLFCTHLNPNMAMPRKIPTFIYNVGQMNLLSTPNTRMGTIIDKGPIMSNKMNQNNAKMPI